MPEEKKTFNKKEKAELLASFGEPLDDQSLRIIEDFVKSGKNLNKMLEKAYQFRRLC
jgi:hypothetical protein